ncbi:extracellular solute-binding protein [Treponema sp.]
MKKNLVKMLGTSLVLVLALSMVACGGAKGSSVKKDKITISLWHIWPDSTTGDGKIIQDFIAKYEAEHPNVDIISDASETESYKAKLKIAFSGGETPDVFFTYGAGFLKPFVDSGRVQAMDEVLDSATRARLLPGTEANFLYDGKLYGLPIKMWAGVLYCNKELFQQAGLEYPETWDMLLKAIETFRARGIQPLCCGGKDAWHPAMYHDILAVREAGIDGVNAAMAGKKRFDDPEFLKAANDFYTIVKKNGFNDGFAGQGAQEAQAEFLMGRIPMYFNGSWLTGDIQNPENQVKDKIVAVSFPSVPGGKGDRTTFTGGAIDGYGVSKESKNLKVAVDVMASLAEYQSLASYLSGDGISVWKGEVDESKLNPVLKQINDLLKSGTGYCLAWDTQLSGADIDTYLSAIQDLQGAGKTPKAYVEHLQNKLSIAKK